MRSEAELMETLMGFAKNDPRIRLVTLEGSRTNSNIPRDSFQDFDLSFFVTDLESFTESDDWLDQFGRRLIMQKPEDMELFPPELGNWFSYLMIFADGHKVDLTLIPLEEVEDYFSKSDGLVEILLDKDSLVKQDIQADDQQYWMKQPTAREFEDCCNEFWMVATYVVKGLARKEILFAIDHLHEIARPNLLRMMSWQIGFKHGYNFSLGKNYKFIQQYLPEEDWELLLSTYSQQGYPNMWQSLFTCYQLFRKYAKLVADDLGFPYPEYDAAITTYTETIYRTLNDKRS
ncbi:aminoglycoside 6-adenylyltransferase [Bacillus sp. J14TS2]|uniref:aminoglycoside 6-adenylyltransferase n=1 Tax=Bacillus sp. J14TS2 TaxID=2807188 RepID=UPI001B2C99A8|nr:aminoglycoside 6-adenylyltransferase [Bacillus sp. J14TS2]GIN72736.1 aminoglycoside 6-adenylyltransferase [Bacillus sp. J14TS2]